MMQQGRSREKIQMQVLF